MERLGPDEEMTVYTDSALSANTINLWAPSWERQGWRRGPKKEPIANLDLVQRLYDLASAHPRAKIEWIKGHAGNRWNEYADQLSRAYQSEPAAAGPRAAKAARDGSATA
jgi:ribonuclease HI